MRLREQMPWRITACGLFCVAAIWTHATEPKDTVASLRLSAEALEQDGRVLEAAKAYEKILLQEPSLTRAVAPRLVQLYAEQNDAASALRWAHVAMKSSPAPRQYLAGVHALLDEHTEAVLILEDAFSVSTDNTQRAELLVSMAASYEALGESSAARTNLVRAVSAARGTPLEAVAQERLKELSCSRTNAPPRMEATP